MPQVCCCACRGCDEPGRSPDEPGALSCAAVVPGRVRSELPGRCAEVQQGRLRERQAHADPSAFHFHVRQYIAIPANNDDTLHVLCCVFTGSKISDVLIKPPR